MTFYLPGMIKYGRERGGYPAISITGTHCDLQCEHCKGRLLEPMIQAQDPDNLVEVCQRLAKQGARGFLLSGGSDRKGRLPWEKFGRAIRTIKKNTNLYISAHTGFPDHPACQNLKKAGVNQALIDVMGDEKTATSVYHLQALGQVSDSLEAIKNSGLEIAPHVVAGLLYGQMDGEYNALEMLRPYHPKVLVIVAITPLKGTPMESIVPPSPLEIARLIASARLLLPETQISLGCERPRNRDGWLLEKLAIHAGINRMAIWSDQALQEARKMGLKTRFQYTCCSVDFQGGLKNVS